MKMDVPAWGLSLSTLTDSWCSPRSRTKNFGETGNHGEGPAVSGCERSGGLMEHRQRRLRNTRKLTREDQRGTVEELSRRDARILLGGGPEAQ